MGNRKGKVEDMGLMFGDIYKGKRVLITGHCGFKSSWLGLWLKNLGATVMGISHPPRSDPNHYKLLGLHDMLEKDIHSDISFVAEINSLFPDLLIHLAAKAIVPKAFDEPEQTFFHNVMGTVHILELCRQCPSIKGVVVITTDKVYEDKNWNWGYRETDKLGGKGPYSASKVCIEQVINCYRESYGLNIAAARAGNVIGGGDWSYKRLIPDIVRATSKGEKVIIHTPNATRPWQHVLEPLKGYLILGQKILQGENVNRAWNFGPEGEVNVRKVLEIAQGIWPRIKYEVDNIPTHPHMVYLLKLDSTEAKKVLGWKPVWSIQQAVEKTIQWYKSFYEKGLVTTGTDILNYEEEIS